MVRRNLIRVCAAALALSTLSFAAGVAGDLSDVRQRSGERVVLRIPPELPPDSPRAGPLPPRTPSAAAAERPEPTHEPAPPDHEVSALSTSEAFAMLEGGPLLSPAVLQLGAVAKPELTPVWHAAKPAAGMVAKPESA